jgi:hypothetical protein
MTARGTAFPLDRRALLGNAIAASLFGSVAEGQAADSRLPWIKRFLHLYTGDDGLTRAEMVPFDGPGAADTQQLLRRNAERVTLGSMAPGFGYDFHVANQPTLLIPLFGSIVIVLADGTVHEFGHGDVAYAEDCTGKGHISRAGKDGCFTVQVQLAKPLCPPRGSSDMARFWREPA